MRMRADFSGYAYGPWTGAACLCNASVENLIRSLGADLGTRLDILDILFINLYDLRIELRSL